MLHVTSVRWPVSTTCLVDEHPVRFYQCQPPRGTARQTVNSRQPSLCGCGSTHLEYTANWRRCGKLAVHLPSTVKTFLIEAVISKTFNRWVTHGNDWDMEIWRTRGWKCHTRAHERLCVMFCRMANYARIISGLQWRNVNEYRLPSKNAHSPNYCSWLAVCVNNSANLQLITVLVQSLQWLHQ